MVSRWAAKGLLYREFRGVYRFGHRAPSPQARYLAAVLACGPGAVISGRAALWLYGLLRGAAPPPEVIARTDRRHPGILVHRAGLGPADAGRHEGIPVTTVARTLVDVAGDLPMDALALLCHQAQVRYRLTAAAVDAVLARRPRAPGVARLRAILHGDHPLTLSRMERGFLAWLRAHRFPLPATNVGIDRGYVDCRWPEHRLTVELDSYRFHGTRHAWTQDLRRDRAARARGDRHRRYTWADIFEDDTEMLRELDALLPRRGSSAVLSSHGERNTAHD
ncbi:MAG: hypothetical protein JWM73_1445 [Solirubrobacterales bacterium]|nr:hypothetical protein [Solirubrobacterales bacterium]